MSSAEDQGAQTSARRTRRRMIRVAVFVLAAGGVLYVLGLTVPEALLVAIAGALLVSLRRLPFTDSPVWPRRGDDHSDHGTRREVARLSWDLQGFEQRVERSSVQRLRRIAARRLADQGLHLEDPADATACRAALAESAYTILNAPQQSTPPTLVEFTRAVAAVERLAPVNAGRRVLT